MPLPNLPEDFLLNKLPEMVATEDVRRLVAAVVGGYQERVSDFRTAITGIQNAYSPDSALPVAESETTVEVVYAGQVGETVRRVLDITDDTPAGGSDLVAWAASECDISEDLIVSATRGSDALRTINPQTLDLLASTLGCYLAVNPLLSAAEQMAEKRKQIAAFFPRLKLKGTAISFELLGRAMGFDDVRFAPLWQRAVPHAPYDIGAAENATDFSRDPDVLPSATLPDPDRFYDPAVLDDGPYYAWTGTGLRLDPTEPDYLLSINGRQPWVNLIASDTLTTRPAPSTYVMDGGGPYTKAKVALSPEVVAEATGAGPSFNGLRIEVTDALDSSGTVTNLRIFDRLSKRKYRSPWYDIGLAVDIATHGTVAVQDNPDVYTTVANLSGTCLANGKPLTGNTAGEWSSAAPDTPELNYADVTRMAAHAMNAFETVRPATRHLRQLSVGFSWSDEVGYAPYDIMFGLATVGGTLTGVASGFPSDVVGGETTAYDGIFQRSGVTYYTGTHTTAGTRTAHKADFIYVENGGTHTLNTEMLPDSDVMYVTGTWCSGTYNTADRSYRLVKSGAFGGSGSVYARWVVTDTQAIRSEPVTNTIRSNDRPEDDLNAASAAAVAVYEFAIVDEDGNPITDETDDEFAYE